MVGLATALSVLVPRGRDRVDPQRVGHVGLLGLVLRVLPARWWPLAMRLVGLVILFAGVAIVIGGLHQAT